MHQNYYFLKKVSEVLQKKLVDKELLECYSQKGQEVVLSFANEQGEFHIKAVLSATFSSLIFPEAQSKPKKYFVNLFKEALFKKVTGVNQFQDERSFEILLEEELSLVFQFFGRRTNLLLCKTDQVIASFKNATLGEKISKDREIEQSKTAFIREKGNLKKVYPTFGKKSIDWLEGKKYISCSIEKQWELVQELLAELTSGHYYINKDEKYPQLLLFKSGQKNIDTQDPLEAANIFSYEYLRLKRELDLRQKITKSLEHQLSKLEGYIQKAEHKLHELKSGLGYREMADIIMANLHQIKEREKKVKLFNFYTNKEVDIKLKPDLSPQKNAENFYRKAKNQKIEIGNLQKNKEQKEELYLKLHEKLENVKKLDFYALKDWAKVNGFLKEQSKKEEVKPFKVFEVDGFTVYVGKNAVNNDLLTLKYAHKNDLWLHAKDVSGSHTVIKVPSGKKVPEKTIETVASIAAYYSKRKTETLCPVIVTPKKFVRKRKGAPAGQVVVEREGVVLVPPGLPN